VAEREIKNLPGHPERILRTGRPRGGNEFFGRVPADGGLGPPFPAQFGDFGQTNPIQSVLNIFGTSILSELLVVGGGVLFLYYAFKKKKGG
jgi:hypothetical protein